MIANGVAQVLVITHRLESALEKFLLVTLHDLFGMITVVGHIYRSQP